MIEQTKYVNFEDYIPYHDRPLNLNTIYGIRKGNYNSFSGEFYLTDCNHPMQNCRLSSRQVTGWCYKNSDDYFDFPPIVNKWARRRASEELLKTIKISWVDRIKMFFKYV